MKKTLLIISLVACFAIGGNAQSKDVRYGLKLGPSFDWAGAGSVVTQNKGMKMGFNLGFVYDRYYFNHIAVSTGVNVNFLRLKYQFRDSRRVENFLEEVQVDVNRRLKATNIEVPLKVKLNLDVVDSFKAYVEAGGALSFNVKDAGKDEYEFYAVSYADPSYSDCSDQYRLLQGSLVFGVGAEYEINRNLSAFVQLTFDHALSNAFNKDLVNATGSIIRNNFIGVEVGVMH